MYISDDRFYQSIYLFWAHKHAVQHVNVSTNASVCLLCHSDGVRFRFPDTVYGRDPFNQNFRKFWSKTQWIGSVQPEKFRKNWSIFWGGPLFWSDRSEFWLNGSRPITLIVFAPPSTMQRSMAGLIFYKETVSKIVIALNCFIVIIFQPFQFNVIFRVTEENISTEGEPPAKASRVR